MSWFKITPGFLVVLLEDKVTPFKEKMLSDNLVFRCLGPKTITSVLSEFIKKGFTVNCFLNTCCKGKCLASVSCRNNVPEPCHSSCYNS